MAEQNLQNQAFYKKVLELMQESKIPFLIGGAFSLTFHTGVSRDTKDLDIYVEAKDYTHVLDFFAERGFEVQVYDVRWIVKIFKGDLFADVIFNSTNNICRVDHTWFERSVEGSLFDCKVRFLSPEELLWSKSYVRNRERYDGADICHLILKQGKEMDWKHVLERLDPHWHLLLIDILLFQFVYPSDFMSCIPKWLFDELITRAQEQYKLPAPLQRVCRGPLIDNTQYAIDVKEWDYKSYTIITV